MTGVCETGDMGKEPKRIQEFPFRLLPNIAPICEIPVSCPQKYFNAVDYVKVAMKNNKNLLAQQHERELSHAQLSHSVTRPNLFDIMINNNESAVTQEPIYTKITKIY